MLHFIRYLINLILLKFVQFRKKQTNRFENYSPNADIADHRKVGLLTNNSDWDLSTPNLNRKENVSIIASNTFNKSSLILNLKWRPSSGTNLATLVSRLTFELNGSDCFDYEDISTYSPASSQMYPDRITQYGSNGSCLKLFVIVPYSRYRIVFRGHMRERKSGELRFVKLNLLAFKTSKIYDFAEQFDADYLAKQVADKQPKCGLKGALNEIVLHDRHEQTIRLIGGYSIEGDNKVSDELHLWGFHSRQFIESRTKNLRNKRILGHFSNGRAFHIGVNENIENNFDPKQRFTFGYVCFRIGPTVKPIVDHRENKINWNQVGSNTCELKFAVSGQELTFQVEASERESSSIIMDAKLNHSTIGWAIVLINDSLDTAGEIHAIESSLRQYQQALDLGEIIDHKLLAPRDVPGSKQTVVDIDDPDCLDSGLVGAKASSLAQLRQLDAPKMKRFVVSDAIMLTRYAYESIQAANPNLMDSIRRLAALIGQGNLASLGEDCGRVQRLFEDEAKMPETLQEEIKRQMKIRFSLSDIESLDGKSFAVRSSSWGEDEEDISAAGQLSTVLNVKTLDGLMKAIMECFASKFNNTNIEYKRQHGLPLDLPMAVVVQEMISCEKAGVLFTCDPTTGNPMSMLINANYGLGESVVSGQAEPDTIRVKVEKASDDRSGAKFAIEYTLIGSKKVIISGPNSGDENPVDRNECCLSEAEVMELAQCGHHLAHYFQSQRDIEWGFKDNQLYLFQSRPVTGLDTYTEFELFHESDSPSRAELEFFSRANICEVMPYAATPLQNSFGIKLWPIVSNRFFNKLKTIDPEDYCLNYSAEIVVCNYHAFFSLRSKALFNFALQEDGERSVISRSMEVGIFGHEVDDPELVKMATDMSGTKVIRFEEQRFNFHTAMYQLMPFKAIEQARKSNIQLRRDINSLRFSSDGSSIKGLYEQYLKVNVGGVEPYVNHVACTMISSKANFSLMQLLSKYIKDPVKLHAAFSNFLASSANVLSAEIPRRVERMAKLIGNRGKREVEAFCALTPSEGLKYVSREMRSELAEEFDNFMTKFGHRCYNEFELSSKAWRDTPEKIIEMLQTNMGKYLNNGNDAPDESKKSMTLDEAIRGMNVELSLCDRFKLKYLIAPKCQRFVSVREQTKDIVIEFVDITRDACRLLARELRQNNRIPDEDLFFFLFNHEVEAIVRSPQPSIVVQANRRRRLFNHFKVAWRFDEISRGYAAVPLHLRPSKELDERVLNSPKLLGTTASSGKVRGKVCLVEGYGELNKVRSGDILVTYCTDIAFSPVFPLVSGVITEVGGLISHGAVVAREYGLPSVIGIPEVTKILKHGEEIILDADNGAIIRLGPVSEEQW